MSQDKQATPSSYNQPSREETYQPHNMQANLFIMCLQLYSCFCSLLSRDTHCKARNSSKFRQLLKPDIKQDKAHTYMVGKSLKKRVSI